MMSLNGVTGLVNCIEQSSILGRTATYRTEVNVVVLCSEPCTFAVLHNYVHLSSNKLRVKMRLTLSAHKDMRKKDSIVGPVFGVVDVSDPNVYLDFG